MQRLFFLLGILFSSIFSFGQDSVRVTLCVGDGSQCFAGAPSLNKTIEYYDSAGYLYKSSFYNFYRCDPEYADSAFLHTSDIYYAYDSAGNMISEDQYNFDGDTAYNNHWLLAYTYDSAGHRLTQTNTMLFPPSPTDLFDSAAYNQAGNIIYEIRLSWNSDISALDTTDLRIYTYDSLEREIEFDSYSYSNFIFNRIYHTYTAYDTASNIISHIYSNSANSDSTRFLSSYDTLNRSTETWDQRWDTLLIAWVNYKHSTFEYDSLHLLIEYNFGCFDSLCTDTASKTEYGYDSAGRLTSTESYFYNGPGWTFTGESYTYYDNWDMITGKGWWVVNFCGCDESDHSEYTYNANHELIHSHETYFTCDYYDTDCDYYALGEDSMLVILHFDQRVCPFDSSLLNVTVAGGIPPYTYEWMPGSVLSDSTVESPFSFADTTTIFTLKVIDSIGFVQVSSDTLWVHPKNIHPVAIISPPACFGQQAFMTFDTTGMHEPFQVEWILQGYGIFSFADTLFTTQSGDYTLYLVDQANGCDLSTGPVQPVFLTDPGAHIELLGDSIFCEGDSAVLQSTVFPSVVWNTGDTSVSIYAFQTGNYFASIVDSNGCADTSNIISITALDLPVVNLGTDTTLCVNQLLTLDAGAGFMNYSWNDGNSLQTSQVLSAVPDTLTYSVFVTDSNSCINGDTIEVIYDACLTASAHEYDNNFEVFPNPVSQKLIVKSNSLLLKKINLSVYNVLGDKLLSEDWLNPLQASQSKELDVSNLPPGIYFLEATSPGNIFRIKFVKK